MSLKVFCSYSHNDEPLKDELAKHLTMLEREGVISTWCDRKIPPGTEWDQQINENLNTADIILLLVSSDFIHSEYCWGAEVTRAIKRHEAGEACVIPIILRNVSWQLAPFARLQALPKNAQPVTSWNNPDDAFTDVAEGIKFAAEQLIRAKAIAQYRQKVEKFASDGDGDISSGELKILKRLEINLGLIDSEASTVQKEVLKPYKRRKEHIDDYRELFIHFVAQHRYPLDERAKKELNKLQLEYELKDEDVVEAKLFTENLGDGVVLEIVAIPGGKFLMGSPENELQRDTDESPQHTVIIQPFFMGKFPVTQSQWAVVAALKKVKIDLNPDPSYFKGANRPVEKVSWDDAIEFCARLSNKTGKTYRLPSEAEWEYACRARTTTPFYFGETITTDLANYRGTDWNYQGTLYPGNYGQGPKGEFRQQTTDVGKFPPNPFGLFDIHGNIWEWCQDAWHENYNGAPADGSAWMSENDNRLLRGGTWDYNPGYCRSAYRFRHARDDLYYCVGFRVVVAAPLRT